jgi:tRNA-2-methylthio-N6-dimethylallyladenosine synthase
MRNNSFFIKTFGCQMNERDSEIMAQSLSEKGYTETVEMDKADLIIINTCSIRAKAEQKVMSLLGMLKKNKIERPEMTICVAGCVAQQEGEQLFSRMPFIDLVLGTQNIYDIPELIERCRETKQTATSMVTSYAIPRFIPDFFNKKHTIDTTKNNGAITHKKFVTIMQGCNNFCTYCVVPYTRGREISRIKNDIIDEINVLVENGIKEVTLLGQNVNSYGVANKVDEAPYSFASLLRDVARIVGLERLRFTTSHPKDLSEDLICCFKDLNILCNHIHLPVQAGSDSVLQRMNRHYSIANYLEKVSALRSVSPDITISTDIIVGFPGETDKDFEQTLDLLDAVRFDSSFSFKYSDRPGTKSSKMENKITEQIKSDRLCRFQARQNEISLEKNRALIGKTLDIMVDSIQDQGFQGRTRSNHLVHVDSITENLCPGNVVDVFIVHAGQHSLKGTFVH